MRALLLPIKDLKNAKQRLAGLFSPEQRFGLAQAMLADTVNAIRDVQAGKKIFVATNYEPAILVAQEYGWEILREHQQTSESDSVDAASRICEQQGVTALLRLPLDLPLLRPQRRRRTAQPRLPFAGNGDRALQRRHRNQRTAAHSTNTLPLSFRHGLVCQAHRGRPARGGASNRASESAPRNGCRR